MTRRVSFDSTLYAFDLLRELLGDTVYIGSVDIGFLPVGAWSFQHCWS